MTKLHKQRTHILDSLRPGPNPHLVTELKFVEEIFPVHQPWLNPVICLSVHEAIDVGIKNRLEGSLVAALVVIEQGFDAFKVQIILPGFVIDHSNSSILPVSPVDLATDPYF